MSRDVVIARPVTRDDPRIQGGKLGASPVYSVFLRVGDTREWILEYSAAAASDVHANPFQINPEDAGPITPLYPVTTLAPNSMPEKSYLGTSCSMDI